MSYFLTEEQELIRDAAREFAETQVKPQARALDATHEFPWDWVNQCAELGFLGVSVPSEYGGAGADCVSEMLVIEEIARFSGALALIIDAHTSLGCMPLLHAGTEEQKQKYLVPAAQGKNLMSFGLTEPNAGSDAGGTVSTAVLDGDEWVLNGEKAWITNIQAAKTYIATFVTDPGKGTKGISAFIIEDGTPGFRCGEPQAKMGLHNSFTGSLFFQDCRIPKENLLGELNRGFPVFMQGLDEGRLAVSAMAVGMAQGAMEQAIDYAKQREQFGKTIVSFQAIQFMIAEMAIEIEAARCLLYNAARLRDAGLPYTKQAAMLKAFSSEMCLRVVDKSLQIHGGNGYSADYDIERFYRDAKLLTIGEGTSEINRVVVAGHVIGR